VLPSVEDDFDEDPLIESREDVGPSAWYLSAAYWNSLTFTRASTPDDPRLAQLGKSPIYPIFRLLPFVPSLFAPK
jgi:hypothetical protein